MEVTHLPQNALKVPPNFRALLFGASEAGKSYFIGSLIRNKNSVFDGQGYSKFIYCSPNLGDGALSSAQDFRYQQSLEEWAHPAEIVFLNEIISEKDLVEEAEACPGKLLLIVDDFSMELLNTELAYKLFTRLSSHKAIDSCVSIHQGIGSKISGNWFSCVKQNCNFQVFFRNIANRAAIGEASKQIFPYANNFLQKCLNLATSICGVHAYICVDANLKNPLNTKYGVRTNIFGENGCPMIVFKNPRIYYGDS